jgi:hypothetical protein
MRVYDAARNGWYSAAGGVFRYGLQIGATFGRSSTGNCSRVTY